jgi:hypothetical protein
MGVSAAQLAEPVTNNNGISVSSSVLVSSVLILEGLFKVYNLYYY